MKFPHQLSFLNREKCDVCENDCKEFIQTKSKYFGWNTCTNKKCNKTIQKWYNDSSIKNKILLEKFGKMVCIQRTDGKIDSGWIIDSDAQQEEKNGVYWIQVKHPTKHLSKQVKLSDLKQWNNINT